MRYTILLLLLIVLVVGNTILPSEMVSDSHADPDHCAAILSGPIVPVSLAISESTHFRGRISNSLIPTGWHRENLKNDRHETAFNRFSSHYPLAYNSEITLISLDCMLQV
jgi:hypothetical protein